MNLRTNFVLYPFLFSIFPILSLFLKNIYELNYSVVFIPLFVAIFSTFSFFVFLNFFISDRNKTSMIILLFWILFFSYGYFYLFLSYRMLTLLWFIILFSGSYAILKKQLNVEFISKFLNKVSCLLLLVILIPLFFSLSKVSNSEFSSQKIITEFDDRLPDIYYLIFDGHASFSTLENFYDFDNTEFKNYLENKGFFIPSRSQSNYPSTGLSLSSSLNIAFIHDVIYNSSHAGIFSGKNVDAEIKKLLKYNKVSEILKSAGYKIIHFSSYVIDENEYADDSIRYNPLGLNDFNLYLIESSWLRHLFKTILIDKFRRGNVLFLFENLKKIELDDQPVFVFMHFISPHPPFLFDREGNLPKLDEYAKTVYLENEWLPKEKYVDQLVFIDEQIKESVNYLLNDSERTPIIILQADHGPKAMYSHENPTKTKGGLEERFSIFNAYYFPFKGNENLYDDITPVNSFRVLFNYYLGTDYALLEDKSYFPINKSSTVFATLEK